MVRPIYVGYNADVGATYAADCDSSCSSGTIRKSIDSFFKEKTPRTEKSAQRNVIMRLSASTEYKTATSSGAGSSSMLTKETPVNKTKHRKGAFEVKSIIGVEQSVGEWDYDLDKDEDDDHLYDKHEVDKTVWSQMGDRTF